MTKEDNREFYAEVKAFKCRKPPRKVLRMIDGELTEPKQKARTEVLTPCNPPMKE